MRVFARLWDKQGRTLRPPEIVAIALLCVTTAFYLLVLRPAEARLTAMEQALQGRKAQLPIVSGQHRGSAPDLGKKLGAFYTFFQKDRTFTDWLARLYDVAERTGVELQQGEYRQVDHGDVPLTLREVTLPISGDYARIRAFAEGALNAIPVASLDRISFRRQQSVQSRVEAELKFTFYLPAGDK
ncbi:MAG: hypothetical protein HYS20_05570 [Rhodocyclales bacterium]|nr:hypothetical protein [Rhodocyclales bacterium]